MPWGWVIPTDRQPYSGWVLRPRPLEPAAYSGCFTCNGSITRVVNSFSGLSISSSIQQAISHGDTETRRHRGTEIVGCVSPPAAVDRRIGSRARVVAESRPIAESAERAHPTGDRVELPTRHNGCSVASCLREQQTSSNQATAPSANWRQRLPEPLQGPIPTSAPATLRRASVPRETHNCRNP